MHVKQLTLTDSRMSRQHACVFIIFIFMFYSYLFCYIPLFSLNYYKHFKQFFFCVGNVYDSNL